MFPRKVRAMALDGVVDPVAYSKNAEARIARGVAPSDEVFDQFLARCRKAGPARCALAGHRRTPEALMNRLLRRTRHTPVPAPQSDPPGRMSYIDLLLSQFEPMRSRRHGRAMPNPSKPPEPVTPRRWRTQHDRS